MTDQRPVKDCKDLQVWQKGMLLAQRTYQLTQRFPSEEKFGLISQMRRAAISVPCNIAEGQARHATGEFNQFLSHAEGSIAELDTQTLLSIQLKFCREKEAEDILALIVEIRKMVHSLRRRLLEQN
ncbi:MAG TPA: four helix bundle protein [Terriglobia bacterium]|nr:four helix bundle protein [Terriglobia bacterium]